MTFISSLVVALFALAGSVLGHFLANDLDSARKRRDVRREKIEQFADLMVKGTDWFDQRCIEATTRGNMSLTGDPFHLARAIAEMYFAGELDLGELLKTRRDLIAELGKTFTARAARAIAEDRRLDDTPPTDEEGDAINAAYSRYTEEFQRSMAVARVIVRETLPADSETGKAWKRVRDWLSPPDK